MYLDKVKIKKINFLTGCYTESKRYRIYNIVEVLLNRNIDCEILFDRDLKNIENNIDCDLFVIFRTEYSQKLASIIEKLKQKNIPIVFDVDDLIFEPESIEFIDAFKYFSQAEKELNLNLIQNTKKALLECDYITCSTDFLAQRAEKLEKKSFTIKNTINISQYNLAQSLIKNKQTSFKKVKIGYFSGTKTHQADFDQCSTALIQILKKYNNTELHIIGTLDLDDIFKSFKDRIVIDTTLYNHRYLDLLKHLSSIDINMAPLELNNSFTDSKSELKLFESALVLVPSIVSPTHSYKKYIKHSINGFLASSTQEWVESLSLLIQNWTLRRQVAQNAYNSLVKEFYNLSIADEIINTYKKIIFDYQKNKSIKKNKNYQKSNLSKFLKIKFNMDYKSNFEVVSKLNKPEFYIDIILQNPQIKSKISRFINEHSINNKKICFYGAGLFAQRFIELHDLSKLDIKGIVDSNHNKHGKKIKNIDIIDTDKLKEIKPDYVILTILNCDSCKNFLENFKKAFNMEFKLIFDLFEEAVCQK